MPQPSVRKDWFFRFTAFSYKNFKSMAKNAVLTPEQKELFEFMDYRFTAEQFRAGEIGAMFVGLILMFLVAMVAIILFQGDLTNPLLLISILISVMFPFVLFLFYSAYPGMQAKKEQTLAIGYAPSIVNYLVMSMRLTPNLEKAVEFAAEHGKGKIAEDLKKVIWNVQIGVYNSVEEGLDKLAYDWGKYNEDFKQALMLIRASVIETDTAKREAMLEKAVSDVLEGSKEKMDLYARALHQPTVYLYYFGVLLPLMLAIIIPIAASMGGGGLMSNPLVIALIYTVFIPAGLLIYGSNIIGTRPPTYIPPNIPKNFPGLPKKGYVKISKFSVPYFILAAVVFVGVILAGFTFDYQISVASINPNIQNVTAAIAATPHVQVFNLPPQQFFLGVISILSILVAISLSTSIILFGMFYNRKKIQDQIRSMEFEFKDAMYVIASRLGENRPIEEAVNSSIQFLPKSLIAKNVFQKILDNITSMGLTLDEAIFNPNFGALKSLPSDVLQSGLKIMVDSVSLGTNVASKSLIGLAVQLRNSEKIDTMLRQLLEDVTSMLGTVSTYIAPVVIGVVASLQQVVSSSFANSCSSSTLNSSATQTTTTSNLGPLSSMGSSNFGNFLCPSGKAAPSLSPAFFILIMGVYVIEAAVILTYFNSQIEDSNNPLHSWMSIARALPIATLIFAAVAYFSIAAVAH